MDDSKIFIVGSNGQLGLALQKQYPNAKTADVNELDITDQDSIKSFDWNGIEAIINAAAYTNVDGAETDEGRVAAWKVNADAVANLVAVTAQKDAVLIHISTDYVFDGTKTPHTEDEPFSPLSVYGASKAAGDIAVSLAPKHYILRTSWVIGDGKNFVKTMLELGKKGISPTVVADQTGRLTFTSELARAIDYLVSNELEFGVYNLTNDGHTSSWAEVTRKIFGLANFKLQVTDTTTSEYFKSKSNTAPRPLQSTLDLTKIHQAGFKSRTWQEDLSEYINKEINQ